MTRPCFLGLIFVAAALCGSVTAQEDPGGTPEDVLGLLQELAHGQMTPHWNSGDFLLIRPAREEIEEAYGEHIVPLLPPGCGNMGLEALPLGETRALLARLFALHGFPLEDDYVLKTGGIEARLDGYDPKRRAGYKFVYGSFKPRVIDDPVLTDRPEEKPEDALDEREFRSLRRTGHRILLVPVDRYVSTANDPFTPLFTCALDAVDFLSSVPDAPALDIEPLAFGDMRAIPAPTPDEQSFPEGENFQESGPATFFVAKRKGTLRMELEPPSGAPATREAPSLLVLRFYWTPPYRAGGYDFSAGRPLFTLRQGAGAEALVIRSGRPVFVLPPSFDMRRPFRLDVELPPGQCHLGRELQLFAAR